MDGCPFASAKGEIIRTENSINTDKETHAFRYEPAVGHRSSNGLKEELFSLILAQRATVQWAP